MYAGLDQDNDYLPSLDIGFAYGGGLEFDGYPPISLGPDIQPSIEPSGFCLLGLLDEGSISPTGGKAVGEKDTSMSESPTHTGVQRDTSYELLGGIASGEGLIAAKAPPKMVVSTSRQALPAPHELDTYTPERPWIANRGTHPSILEVPHPLPPSEGRCYNTYGNSYEQISQPSPVEGRTAQALISSHVTNYQAFVRSYQYFYSLEDVRTSVSPAEAIPRSPYERNVAQNLYKGLFCASRECCTLLLDNLTRSPYCTKQCQVREQNMRQARVRPRETLIRRKDALFRQLYALPETAFDRSRLPGIVKELTRSKEGYRIPK
ncbi:hypothetical protein GMRT_15887 [Giardia muris]|uniref:Uncharacterized protein n=1 Tax=Giardia muris TaxID=5742 RepID=A0A4Z1SYU7_GIAMU|nr:hypothetical protein GMRT_15887 [Giardia muris]|eukprot:TNJ29935.1 hypothetical protein GMRT_15887 [Giardia muris]